MGADLSTAALVELLTAKYSVTEVERALKEHGLDEDASDTKTQQRKRRYTDDLQEPCTETTTKASRVDPEGQEDDNDE